MNWHFDFVNHQACDDENGLILLKQGFQRDNFRFSIVKSIVKSIDNSFQFEFEALAHGTARGLTPIEQKERPEFDEVTTWLVVDRNLNDDQRAIIFEALLAYTNSLIGGFGRILDGTGRRNFIEIKYVKKLGGY